MAAINRWLERVKIEYAPILTAYNLGFDLGKARNTGIDLDMFPERFCLWYLATAMIASTKNYKNFALSNHYFGSRTELGNMSYRTNAECMAHFVKGFFETEPHTAIEDAMHFELPILQSLVNRKGWKKKIGECYDWRNHQLRDHFTAT